jgi:superfamily II DNA or RNA helicase
MAENVIIGYNPVNAKIFKGSERANLKASTILSYLVDGHEHMQGFKSGGWDGRSTFFNWNGSMFPRGFVSMVERELRGAGMNVQIVAKPLPPMLGLAEPKIDAFPFTGRYDYQLETAQELIKRGVMVARVATGGGKSRIAKICHAMLDRPTLFLTTRKALMYQMKEGFEDANWEVGVMGDSIWTPNDKLNVGMVQTLALRLALPEDRDDSAAAQRQRRVREKTIEMLGTIEFIIGEEAHEASGDGYFEVLKHCRKAEYRLALTATPFMKSGGEANMRLMAAFGEIGIEVSEKTLIDRGILATPIFKFFDLPSPKALRKTTQWQRAVELGITTNEIRNAKILQQVIAGKQYGLSSMILVTRKTHGVELSKMMREAGLRIVFLFGETSQAKRKQALEGLRKGLLDGIVGSTILDVGVDVPAIGQMILAGGGKDEVLMRQRIGRGLREKKVGPNVCPIFDFRDRGNKHLQNHSIARQQVIAGTPGFAENFLRDDQEFIYENYGFTKTK